MQNPAPALIVTRLPRRPKTDATSGFFVSVFCKLLALKG